jgi:hypothetical protein
MQIYEHAFQFSFQAIHQSTAALQAVTFDHLSPDHFLQVLPGHITLSLDLCYLELKDTGYAVYSQLQSIGVRGTPRFLPFLFYSWSLSVTIYSNFSDILLFCISLLIFSVVLLIFSTHSHIILTALAPSHLFFRQLSEVILPVSIFRHFDIISHQFKSPRINSILFCT